MENIYDRRGGETQLETTLDHTKIRAKGTNVLAEKRQYHYQNLEWQRSGCFDAPLALLPRHCQPHSMKDRTPLIQTTR
jgi:hypothetical protein